jgi:2-methylfumaryl-CoA hydratase
MSELQGRFFEDFRIGQSLRHATPRTITAGDVALYTALYGSRFAVQSSDAFARAVGYPRAPVDDLLVFNIVFGKTVPDVSLNAVANLGYSEGRFLAPVYTGDTVRADSEVIGLREVSSGKAGVVYVRSTGLKDDGTAILDYVRWVLVHKRDGNSPAPESNIPELAARVSAETLGTAIPVLAIDRYDFELAGSSRRLGDYSPGQRIDHVHGVTVEEAEHQLATRLYQNPAHVHFNQWSEATGRYGRRLVYGGHVISLARALSFNGLANAFQVAGINSGQHVAPLFAGETLFAWSEILDRQPLSRRDDLGALRVRTIATKDRPCGDFPGKHGADYDPSVILDLDYWLLVPR